MWDEINGVYQNKTTISLLKVIIFYVYRASFIMLNFNLTETVKKRKETDILHTVESLPVVGHVPPYFIWSSLNFTRSFCSSASKYDFWTFSFGRSGKKSLSIIFSIFWKSKHTYIKWHYSDNYIIYSHWKLKSNSFRNVALLFLFQMFALWLHQGPAWLHSDTCTCYYNSELRRHCYLMTLIHSSHTHTHTHTFQVMSPWLNEWNTP